MFTLKSVQNCVLARPSRPIGWNLQGNGVWSTSNIYRGLICSLLKPNLWLRWENLNMSLNLWKAFLEWITLLWESPVCLAQCLPHAVKSCSPLILSYRISHSPSGWWSRSHLPECVQRENISTSTLYLKLNNMKLLKYNNFNLYYMFLYYFNILILINILMCFILF